METGIVIIKNTEKHNHDNDFQQGEFEEVIEVYDSPSPIALEQVNIKEEYGVTDGNEIIFVSDTQEEPIDLTFDKSNSNEKKICCALQNVPLHRQKIIIQPTPVHTIFENNHGVKRNADFLNLPPETTKYGNDILMASTSNSHDMHPQVLPSEIKSKQEDVLMMAKSIFSKRTRTLYHWMYPNASKQQVKIVVSRTWDSMSPQEKNIYVTQVLGKFGSSNPNLMINPQLGQIKELPPLPGIQVFNQKTSELQTAISSISNETNNSENRYEQQRKKQKVVKKKFHQNIPSTNQEFADDPELSLELAQFSNAYRNFRYSPLNNVLELIKAKKM